MAATKRIRIEVDPNIDFRTYHVTAQVSAEKTHGGILGGDRHDPFRSFSFGGPEKELTDDTKATIMRFYDIEGIESVSLDINKVGVNRSPAFEWEEIEPHIVVAIKTAVGWVDDDVEIDYRFAGKRYPDGVPEEIIEAEVERQRREAQMRDRMYG